MFQDRLPQGRRSFKTINMKLNKPENLCSKIDFCKADAHMGRLLSTWDDLNLPLVCIYIKISADPCRQQGEGVRGALTSSRCFGAKEPRVTEPNRVQAESVSKLGGVLA